MAEASDEILRRRDRFCQDRSRELQAEKPTWWGWEAFLWLTTVDSVLKIHSYAEEFGRELAAYRRLATHAVERLHGFQVPALLDYDEKLLVLERDWIVRERFSEYSAAGQPRPH